MLNLFALSLRICTSISQKSTPVFLHWGAHTSRFFLVFLQTNEALPCSKHIFLPGHEPCHSHAEVTLPERLSCRFIPVPFKRAQLYIRYKRIRYSIHIWVIPKIGVPQNGWFIMENPIKMDDLGVPLFSETSIYYELEIRSKAFFSNFFLLRKNIQIENIYIYRKGIPFLQ